MMKTTTKYHLPVILYGAIILTVSSIPNLKTPEAGTWPIDKLAHLIEYAGLAILIYRSSVRWHCWSRPGSALWMTLLVSSCWGLLDEWLQSYIPGRFSDWRDFIADVGGASLVVGIVWLRQRKRLQGNP
ncbi:MAG: VanZ family protein [candidate division Zixibacteria bacterium]|nr:VanZ family protein [candidate division Zixibacteria bacterium]